MTVACIEDRDYDFFFDEDIIKSIFDQRYAVLPYTILIILKYDLLSFFQGTCIPYREYFTSWLSVCISKE